MITHELVQGSPEWHDFRAKHMTASDAPAMMGESPYKTRAQLLREKHHGSGQDAVDPATQRRFDDGHRFEALARPIAEKIIGEELYQAVGSQDEYAASFDGITMLETIWFEHKSLNNELREILSRPDVTGKDLPMLYQIQMEHQAAVCGGIKCLFMASKWDEDDNLVEELHCWYTPNPELRKKIGQGWMQFKKDLADYKHAEAPAEMPSQAGEEAMPMPTIIVRGEVRENNLPALTPVFDKFLAAADVKPVTDDDFGVCDANGKAARKAAKRLLEMRQMTIDQITPISEAIRTMESYADKFNKLGIKLEGYFKTEKDNRKSAMVSETRVKYAEHVSALQAEIQGVILSNMLDKPDFAEAIKGLKKLSSMQEALDTALANGKIDADTKAKDVRDKLAWCKEHAAGYSALFPDLEQLISKPMEDFTLTITSRIDKHKAEEAAKMEAERQRMEAIAKEKAEREAAATLAAAEARIRAEERAKAEAEAEAEAKAKAEAEKAAQNVKRPVAAPQGSLLEAAERISGAGTLHNPRPTDDAIIEVLALHYRVHESKVIEWLLDVDLKAAGERLKETL